MPKKQKTRILLVEDNPVLNSEMASTLRKKYLVDQVTTLHGGLNYLSECQDSYDVIVLDEQLPDGNGFSLIPFIRQDSPPTKVCVLTQDAQESSRIQALQLGADSYLTKPLSCRGIALHVAALLRRGSVLKNHTLSFFDLSFNAAQRLVFRNDAEVRLSRRESDFLHIFIRSLDGLVSQEDLQRIYWKHGQNSITKGAIHVTIQRLRKKLQPLQANIESIYGLGYRLTV